MRPSRGMGVINPSKMPKKKVIERKDDPNAVEMYAKGGKVKKMAEGDLVDEVNVKPLAVALNPDAKAAYTKTRLSGKKQLGKDSDIEAYIDADVYKMPGQSTHGRASGAGVMYTKRFKDGGKSKVNEAGVYTKPGMRKALFESIKAQAVQGTAAGQWSARKAQLLAKQYKAKGGGYK
jgi:hypothetical protein